MPIWLVILLAVVASLTSLIGAAIGLAYFFDKYFKSRKQSDKEVIEARTTLKLESGSWTTADRIELERRLGMIEGDVKMLMEISELREKIMANVLHSPHRPELDRLLEKLNRGEQLSNAELMFAKDWLWEIASAPPDCGISKGEQAVAGDLYAMLTVKYKAKGAN